MKLCFRFSWTLTINFVVLLCSAGAVVKAAEAFNRQDCNIEGGGHGATFSELDETIQQYGYQVDQDVIDQHGDAAEYRLTKCKMNRREDGFRDMVLEFYGTEAIDPNADPASDTLGFGCVAVYQGKTCSRCFSCQPTYGSISFMHLSYDCSGIDDNNDCDVLAGEACILVEDSVQDHTEACFKNKSSAPTLHRKIPFLLFFAISMSSLVLNV